MSEQQGVQKPFLSKRRRSMNFTRRSEPEKSPIRIVEHYVDRATARD